MAKKIKFSLEMPNGVKVRDLKTLKKNFYISKVIEYFISGKLEDWLEVRGYDDIQEKVVQLDVGDKRFMEKLCEIFEVNPCVLDDCEKNININDIYKHIEKQKLIKQYIDDERIWKNVDIIATNQNELDNLLNTIGINSKIYLLGKKFELKKEINKIIMIGIGDESPKLVINTPDYFDLMSADIAFENIDLDEKINETKKNNLDRLLLKYRLQKALQILDDTEDISVEMFDGKMIDNELEDVNIKSIIYRQSAKNIREILKHFENVAITQEELNKLLKKKEQKIWLYKGKFIVEKDIKNVELIAIEEVKLGVLGIERKGEFDSTTCLNNNVKLTNITFDDVYEQLPCYITTAIIQNKGKSDTCYELEMFRNFRDEWLVKTSEGTKLVEEYYLTAPKIIKSIDRLPEKNIIYNRLWHDYLSKCLYLLQIKEYELCKEKYMQMTNECKKFFLGEKYHELFRS